MPSVTEIYDEANRLKEADQLPEAAAKLKEALALDPDYVLAHSALGVVLQKLGQHDEAIEHAARACELEPRDSFNFAALSIIYQRAFAGTGNREYIQMAEDAMARSRMIEQG